MKYVEFMKYLDDSGKELVDERRDIRLVDISEKDAAEMNSPNMTGDGSLAYRKATKEDLEKLGLKSVTSAPGSEVDDIPEGEIGGKGYEEWTVKELKKFAEDEELHLEGTKKEEIWNEILEALADPLD